MQHSEKLSLSCSFYTESVNKDLSSIDKRHKKISMFIGLFIGSTIFIILAFILGVYWGRSRSLKHNMFFWCNLHHEIRTPLNIIQGYAHILQAQQLGPLPRQYQDYIGSLADASKRIIGFFDRFFFCFTGNMPAAGCKCDFSLGRLFEEIKAEHQEILKGREFIIHNISPLRQIHADRYLMKAMLESILDNAIKHTAADTGKIIVNCLWNDIDSTVNLNIQDNGSGFMAQGLSLKSGPLTSYPYQKITNAQGSGLGLFFVHAVIRFHGGRIAISTQLEQGTQIVITLPIGSQISDNQECDKAV